MLKMFKVKNYMSFKDEAILDMRATSYKQHPTHLLEAYDENKLIKTVAMYGANASGKSNFISAMFFFEQYIFQQFINRNDKTDKDSFDWSNKKPIINMEPFKLSKDDNDVTEFDIIFLYNNKTIQYGFECTSKEVVNEWYYIDDKKVFERDGENITYGKKYDKYIKSFNKVPKERLYLSVLEYFLSDDDREKILNDFIGFFVNKYDVFLELFFDVTVKSVAGSIRITERLIKDAKFRNKVEKYLRQIDVDIKGLKIEKKIVVDEETGKEKEREIVKTIHDIYDDDGNIVGEKLFDLSQESSGTLRFFAYIQDIIERTENGGVFVVDEISARLHPLLTKLIVDVFQDSSNTKAQLIFTTHDISILNKDQFRRDEVVFVDKNRRGESTLYALSDLKIREDASFDKDYMRGKYGAIPIFKYDDILGGDNIG